MEAEIKIGDDYIEYFKIEAETKEKLFEKIYLYFKSEQYSLVRRKITDKELEKEYLDYVSNHSLWHKYASENDYY